MSAPILASGIPATITITAGESVFTVSVQDALSLGFLANGAGDEYGRLYDGHGHLLDQRMKPFAEDLAKIMQAASDVHTEAVNLVLARRGEPPFMTRALSRVH